MSAGIATTSSTSARPPAHTRQAPRTTAPRGDSSSGPDDGRGSGLHRFGRRTAPAQAVAETPESPNGQVLPEAPAETTTP